MLLHLINLNNNLKSNVANSNFSSVSAGSAKSKKDQLTKKN